VEDAAEPYSRLRRGIETVAGIRCRELSMTFVNRTSDFGPLQAGQDGRSDQPRAGVDAAAMIRAESFQELTASITEEDRALWCMMKPRARPSFTEALLDDLKRVQGLIGRVFDSQPTPPFDYGILGSDVAGVFNLGGDLALFVEHIRNGDRAALLDYGRACCDVVHANHTGYGRGLITIGLVEGDALGGGWESAASCDVLVAERRARFGLPEILFNLFPGMGAYSFLSRRVGPMKAEELILSGKVYTAEEMHALGLVDVLAEDGRGREAVRRHIAANRGKRNAHSALFKVRRRVDPVSLSELHDVVEIWVDTALALSEQDLKKMLRIAAAQDRLRDRARSPANAA
jgi:DSF synthase